MSTTSAPSRTAGRGARHALTASALALTALLMPLGAPTAHADPDATPGPVLDQPVGSPADTRSTPEDPHPESALTELGCKQDCITSLYFDVHGTSAQVTVWTNTPTTITLSAYSPNKVPGFEVFGDPNCPEVSAATSVPSTISTVQLKPLECSEYWFFLSARDGSGNEYLEYGSFTT